MKVKAEEVLCVLQEILWQKFHAKCERDKTFPWLKVGGTRISASVYFGAPVNCLFQFDSPADFTRDRGHALESYPKDVPLGFNVPLYKELCGADRRRSTRRTQQRAEHDAALDLLPSKHGLNPTLRFTEAEIREKIAGAITEKKLRVALEALLEKRLSVHGGTTFLQMLDHPSGKPFTPRMGL